MVHTLRHWLVIATLWGFKLPFGVAADAVVQAQVLMYGRVGWDAELQAATAAIVSTRLKIPNSNVTTQLLSSAPGSPGRKLQTQTSLVMQVNIMSAVDSTGKVLADIATLGNDSEPAVMALQARGYDLSNVQLQGMRVTYQKGAFQHGPPPPPRHDTLALAVVSAVLSTVIVLQALGLWLAYSRHRTKLGVRRKWQAMHWPYRQWASSQAGSLPFRSPTVSVDPLQDQAPASLASGAGSSQPEQPAAAVELHSQPPAEPAEPGPAVPALPLASLPVGPRRTVPAGLPDALQQMYIDFVNVWATHDAPWQASAGQAASLDSAPPQQERQPSHSSSMLWHPSSTDSEGQNHRRPSNQSAVSAMSGMHLHVREWQLSTSELSFTFSADGELVVIYTDSLYTAYRAVLRGTIEVAVQVTKEPVAGKHRRAIIHMAEALWELNSKGTLAHFHGVVLDERPMLVIAYEETGIRARSTGSDPMTWHTGGQRLAIRIMTGIIHCHQHGLAVGLRTDCIRLDAEGRPKLCTAGIRSLLLATRLARHRDIVPIDWAAPEVLLDLEVTPAVDVFAFGVFLWELVTGDLPIKGAMRDVTVPDECPASIRALIVDCMSGQAADRPSDTEVLARLQRAASCGSDEGSGHHARDGFLLARASQSSSASPSSARSMQLRGSADEARAAALQGSSGEVPDADAPSHISAGMPGARLPPTSAELQWQGSRETPSSEGGHQ